MTKVTTPGWTLPADVLERIARRAPRYDAENAFCAEDLDELRAAGWLRIGVPVEQGGSGLGLFVAGLGLTLTTSLLTLLVGHKVLKIPLGVLFGVVAGVHTQPAALAFAAEQTGGDLPNLGYTTVFPVATVAKIVLVQILLSVSG